jgi:uncharacterized protein (TIGR03437 family)
VSADWAAGAVYVASDAGVFYGRTDLRNSNTTPIVWRNLTEQLPTVRATDVLLDPARVQVYIALDGYGVFAAAAPHRQNMWTIVNTADRTARAAAPGSPLSIVGGRVNSVTGGNLNYPVLAVQDSETQIQVPFQAVGPNVALAMQTAAGGVITMTYPVRPVSPAIMLGSDGVPTIFDADSQLPVDSKNAAHSNGRLAIIATGLGKVQPEWNAGVPAPLENPPVVVADVKAFLDGTPVQVTKATLAGGYTGFYVIEIQLPSVVNAGTSELRISADGQDSNRVQILLEP